MQRDAGFRILMSIASNRGRLSTSTGRLSRELGISQQSVSRKLRQLEAEGLIDRHVSPAGCVLSLASGGRKLLRRQYSVLSEIFSGSPSSNSLSGTVESGLGEGRYYVSLSQYRQGFREKLKLSVYPGTLNLRTNLNELEDFLSAAKEVVVPGFETRERSFGSIRCFKVMVAGSLDGALIIPERTAHDRDVVEVIARDYLREKLKLKDGSILTLTS